MGSVIGWDRYVGPTGAGSGCGLSALRRPSRISCKVWLYGRGRRCRCEGPDCQVDKVGSAMTTQRRAQALNEPAPAVARIRTGRMAGLPLPTVHCRGRSQKLVEQDGLDRRNVQSVDLRKGYRREPRLRCVIKAAEQSGDLDVMALYEKLAIEDIQHAAEVLRPVYEESRWPETDMSASRYRLTWRWIQSRRSPRQSGSARAVERPNHGQGAGDQAGIACHPPTHRRRHQRQHHLAIFAAGL